ncbi:MAG TPA: FeoA family protein [Leptolyngbya sp.]|jgi:ferrous iron transport protein A|nr:FeoA family protein [Leptolyngbya sp.]
MNDSIGSQTLPSRLSLELKHPAIAPKGFPLAIASIGERLTITQLKGSETNKQRLIGMGLLPSVEIQIISNQSGAIVLAIADCRIGLSSGMAQKIIVTPTV